MRVVCVGVAHGAGAHESAGLISHTGIRTHSGGEIPPPAWALGPAGYANLAFSSIVAGQAL